MANLAPIFHPGYAIPKVVAQRLPKRPHIAKPKVSITLMRDEKGNVVLNPIKKYLRPYWLETEPRSVTLPATGVDPRPSEVIIMPIDNQGPMEINQSMFHSDGDFSIQVFDAEFRRLLANRELHIRTFAGTAEAPLLWPEPLMLHPENSGKAFFVVFRNLINQPNTIRFTFGGRRIFFHESPQFVIDKWEEYAYNQRWTTPYFLTTEQNMTSQGGAPELLNQFIRNPDDADFEWFKLSNAVINLDQNPVRDYEFRMIEKANGRPFMNNFILNRLALGGTALSPTPTGLLPFDLWEPTFLERNYKLQLEVQELENDAQDYWITLMGRKVFHAK